MKFFIYNPPPPENCFNPYCDPFHSKTGNPYHNFDCYREMEREPLHFLCTDRINELSEPMQRHKNRKYEKELRSYRKTNILKKPKMSSRLEHLAAASFRRVFAAQHNFSDSPNVKNQVKMNLNMHLQKSMSNIYSRLENVNFPNNLGPRR